MAKFEWYQHMMEAEAKENRPRAHGLNFKAVEEQISAAAAAWIRTEAKVRAASEEYKELVDRECDLYLQQARREKAAELYGGLRRRAEDVLSRCGRIKQNMKAAAAVWSRRIWMPRARAPAKALRTHRALRCRNSIARSAIRRISSSGGGIIRQPGRLGRCSPEVTASRGRRIRQGSSAAGDGHVDRRCVTPLEPEQVVQDLNQLDGLAVPLWRYDRARSPS